MKGLVAAAPFLAFAVFAPAAHAADLPEIKLSPRNQVPACATPGRLMAFLEKRNPKLDPRFESIATEYMRYGEELAVRWDYAFFQMLVETGYLRFTGDVKPSQNNFAGLGATGGGERGESFKDIASGVRAHLEHVLLYAGEHIDNPIAERTRKVQEWQVLTDWQKNLKGPITFTQMSRKWAPKERGYARDIQSIADAFYSETCHGPDPRPELVQEARAPRSGQPRETAAAPKEKELGAEIARRSIEAEREAGASRSGLGAMSLTRSLEPPAAKPDGDRPAGEASPGSGQRPQTPGKTGEEAGAQLAAAADAAKSGVKPPEAPKCRVWTASYGGQKAVIVKAVSDRVTNYTVLDVNEGAEKREAEAFISAYAKGGETIGEFATPTQALDKAFELCPEG